MSETNMPWKDKMMHLKQHPSPIDLPIEWKSLEQKMDKKRRRRNFLALTSICTVMFLAILFYHILQKHSHQPLIKTNSNQISAKPIQDTTSFALNINEKNISQSNPASGLALNSPPHNKQTIMTHNAPLNQGSNVDITSNTYHNAVDTKDMKSFIAASQETHIPNYVDQSTLNINHNSTSEDIIEDKNLKPEMENTAYLHTRQIKLVSLSKPLWRLTPFVHLKQKSSLFFIDLRTQFGLPIYDYSTKSIEKNTLIAQRQKKEQPMEYIGGALLLGKEIGRQFYTSMGISYQRIQDRWISVSLDTINGTLDGQVTESYTNAEGSVSETIGTKNTKQIVALTQTRYNSIENIAATLAFGRRISWSHWRFIIEANLSLPVYTRFSGQVLNDKNIMVPTSDIYEGFTPLQYGLHASYLFAVSGNVAICGGYDYNFSRLVSNLGYSRTQHIHSLSLGLKYYLNH